QRRNLHQDLAKAWGVVDDLLELSKSSGVELLIYLSMAFGNPYGDLWSPERVLEFVERLVKRGIRQISLADTVGMAEPRSIQELVAICLKEFPQTEFGVHLHSRPEQWEEPVRAALHAGCRRFDGALGGIGGCPFAKDTLIGNIPTERLVRLFNRMGMSTSL